MEELKEKLAEILEVEELDITKKFTDYDEYDSLAALSVMAMLDSDYDITMNVKELTSFDNIGVFCMDVLSRKK